MSGDNVDIFSSLEIDTIGEIMNISMGSAATAASTLLDNKVTITTPIVKIEKVEDFNIKELEPAVAVEIKYVEGISGSNILILRQSDVRMILAQMMQTEISEDFVIDELAESAMCELMNQMMGSSATVLSCFLGRTINISTPTTLPIGGLEQFKNEHFPQKDSLMTITFTITITDVMESEFVSVMDIDLAREIIDVSLNFDTNTPDSAAEEASPAPPPPPDPAPSATEMPPPSVTPYVPPAVPLTEMQPEMPMAPVMPSQAPPSYGQQPYPQYMQQPQPYPAGYNPYGAYPPPQYQGYPPQPPVQQPVAQMPDPVRVQDFSYTEFAGSANTEEAPANIDLVMNVPVVVTVELGRTKRKIKEILEFGQGSVVVLDKQAGSQVDVIVNGQLIARGDVVVVDDNFSIRITEILKSRDSLTML